MKSFPSTDIPNINVQLLLVYIVYTRGVWYRAAVPTILAPGLVSWKPLFRRAGEWGGGWSSGSNARDGEGDEASLPGQPSVAHLLLCAQLPSGGWEDPWYTEWCHKWQRLRGQIREGHANFINLYNA